MPNTEETAKQAQNQEAEQELLRIEDLHVRFAAGSSSALRAQKSFTHALNGVNLSLAKGETLGLVGESGCGKSTIAHSIVQLNDISQGCILYRGRDITSMSKKESLAIRQNIQMVFQDPYASLNPRMTVFACLAEPLQVYAKHGILQISSHEIYTRINEALKRVGLDVDAKYRYPHNFSGGQRQRICIARALMLNPEVILTDEAVSALDVSIQAQIINLLQGLQREFGLSLLFISHDLAVVRHISQRVAIMYCGKIVEMGSSKDVYENPAHPYTQALLSAVNVPNPAKERERSRILLSGNVPSLKAPPTACAFAERCAHAMPRCREAMPSFANHEPSRPSHQVACFLHSSE